MASKKNTVEEGREPLLSHDAIDPDRKKVSIYGNPYEMRNANEFSLRQRRQLSKLAQSMDKTAPHVIADATDLEIDESEAAIDAYFNMAYIDVPEEVVARMDTEVKREFNIVFHRRFMSATETTISKSEELLTEEADLQRRRLGRLTGGTSSQTSKGSTVRQVA
jgi:hypothetical protein